MQIVVHLSDFPPVRGIDAKPDDEICQDETRGHDPVCRIVQPPAQKEEQQKKDVQPVTYFRLDIHDLTDRCEDAALKPKLAKLEETIRYSDPVSSAELAPLEEQIAGEITRLGEVMGQNPAEAETIIAELEHLLADRNRRCKALKQS